MTLESVTKDIAESLARQCSFVNEESRGTDITFVGSSSSGESKALSDEANSVGGETKLLRGWRRTSTKERLENSDPPKVFSALIMLGNECFRGNELSEALEAYDEAIAMINLNEGDENSTLIDMLKESEENEEFRFLAMAAYHNIAIINCIHSRYVEGFENFVKVLEIQEETDSRVNVVLSAKNMINNLIKKEQFDSVMDLCLDAIGVLSKSRSSASVDDLLEFILLSSTSVANMFRRKSDLHKAAVVLSSVLQAQEAILRTDHVDIGMTIYHLGVVYQLCGEHDKALRAFSDSTRIFMLNCFGPDHPRLSLLKKDIESLPMMYNPW
eukprot:CAMPEP_0196807616 /NCGR_PEP_ID=MMETSP1362-20130617/7607_1 /TAXON_ID=163516 /ORGANISM="Leptocylindrus danicus, Strain CCMP1856" /LENGTH=326 /DNA_ID=CAMNT_0042181609 /DNA_START=61 /DNA_END=1038 /DNA_ORIENTATION=+